MNRVIAAILLITYLFGTTDAGQLLKLPLLVSHFVKHKKENPHTTFGSFIKMHYVDPQPMDADYAQDMQLPFKTASDIPGRSIPTVVSMPATISFKSPVSDFKVQPLFNVNIPFSQSFNNIFHPPRA